MSGYRFFKSLQLIAFVGFVTLVGLVGFSCFIFNRLSTEARFRRTYGAEWQAEYEKVYEPITTTNIKVGACALGIVFVLVMGAWIYRLLSPPSHSKGTAGSQSRRHRERYHSPMERTVAYRAKALMRICFGLPGILLGAFLAVFRIGIFSDHSNEAVLGIFIFLAGYGGIISGCSFWLRAKEWNEAIVFIGLMPLAVFFVPFVRLIFLARPTLLLAPMFMMPLILIVVVLVLPDRSGISNRKRWSKAEWQQLRTSSAPDETNRSERSKTG